MAVACWRTVASLVARSLAIPSIVALHSARQLINENELIIVDGLQGVVIVDPDEQVLSEYRLRQHQFDIERQKLKRLRDTRATTLDGVAVELQANIELPDDVAVARENGASGIGLFRSEFLFLNRPDLPDEDEQFEAYRQATVAMDGMPVTIRTYDLGADKPSDELQRHTLNPALGLRAIRYCLSEPHVFLVQLRAMLRASQHGSVRILLPMVAHAHEVDQALAFVRQAKEQLDARGEGYDRGIQVGGMIEIPAAALALPALAQEEQVVPFTDVPDDFMMLPLGGTREIGSHKGYGMMMFVEILTSLLAGSGGGPLRRDGSAHCFMAINVGAFGDAGNFKADMDAYNQRLLDCKPAPGETRVVYAGVPEQEAATERNQKGIPYHPDVIEWFRETMDELGVAQPFN